MIAQWSIKNRAIVDILVIVWIIGGIYSFFHIRKELVPEISFDTIIIETILPAATPEDVETLITEPIEEKIKDLSGIDYLESYSYTSRSEIRARLDSGVSTIEELRREIENAIDQMDPLPDEADPPILKEAKTESNVMVVALTGKAPWITRKQIADYLEKEIRQISGVSNVIVTGLNEREIVIEVNPHQLATYHLTSYDIIQAVQQARADLPAGSIESKNGEISIRSIDYLEDIDALNQLSIRYSPTDGWVQLKDIATIKEGLKDERTRSRINGKFATILTVFKSREGDVIQISNQLKELIQKNQANLPQSLQLTYTQDMSQWVRERLHVAYMSGIWGSILVFFLLAIFLDPVSALWCAYGIPISVLGGTFILYATGSTFNMISIFGFILVIGMLVDDAIVVVENVFRYKEKGYAPKEAIIRGCSEVSGPIVAAVLTTIAALLPLALMSGDMGKFMSEIPKPGIYALIASLLEALVTLPAHLYISAMMPHLFFFDAILTHWQKVQFQGNQCMIFLRRRYVQNLQWVIRYRYIFFLFIIGLFFASIFIGSKVLRFELVSSRDAPLFIVDIKAPIGTSLNQMEQITAEVETLLLQLPTNEIAGLSSTIGVARREKIFDYGKNVSQIMIELAAPEFRKRDADEIMDDARNLLDSFEHAEAKVNPMQGGPPVGSPISVRILGSEWTQLKMMSGKIKDFLATLQGVVDIDDSLKQGQREQIIVVDPLKIKQAGISAQLIANELRTAIDGVEILSVRTHQEDTTIRIRYPESFRQNYVHYSQIKIPSPTEPISLEELVKISHTRGWSTLYHYNGNKSITITANTLKNGIESRVATQKVIENFKALAESSNIQLDFGGEAEATRESLESLKKAALVGFSLIAIILVFQFGNFLQPIAVLSALPLAIIGVIITLIIHTLLYNWFGIGLYTPMGLLPLIGMTALLGVIVNDSIVLVDFVNKLRHQKNYNRLRSILMAGKQRMRPVILTSLTTSAGILPMAYTLRGSSAFLAPMAISFGWGLLFGTFLTLFVVPNFISILDDIQSKLLSKNS